MSFLLDKLIGLTNMVTKPRTIRPTLFGLRSELDPSLASARDPATGELLFGWSNVCMHWFAVPFLCAAAERLRREAAYHVAHKQIPSVDGPVKVLSVRFTEAGSHLHVYSGEFGTVM